MTIIIGLGNPGSKFDYTRHNAGFMVIDAFAKEFNFPGFSMVKKADALVCEDNDIILVKPQTFMNESGKSVQELLKNKNEPILIVVHDDIDLPLGKIKFSKDSGAGGHKGVDSIIQHLGNNHFIRLKVGIGAEGEKVKAEEVVLKKFSPEEQEILNKVILTAVTALEHLIKEGLEKTMNAYH
jgi:PTH1 family peptidyl-tRNA hydrolase